MEEILKKLRTISPYNGLHPSGTKVKISSLAFEVRGIRLQIIYKKGKISYPANTETSIRSLPKSANNLLTDYQNNLENKDNADNNYKILEREGNSFDAPNNESLAHCVR